ncbi:MAG TPA: response regulator [Terriglobales bacterium]|nr:response regulator [Terriglobales bacterium]
MPRPTILIAEPEPKEALSVRKLVVETAKFNVVTAYSAKEAKELLKQFPNVQAMVVVAEIKDCDKAVQAAKAINPSMPVIVLSANPSYRCGKAEYCISSHEPEALLELLRSLFGDPRKVA